MLFQYIIVNKESQEKASDDIKSRDLDYPVVLIVKKHKNARSLDQNALFHVWCRDVSETLKLKGYTAKGYAYTPEDQMKMVWKSMFLEEVDHVLSKKITVKSQVQSTTTLNTGEMFYFMEQIQAWCSEKGIPLTVKGEYEELKNEQIR